MKVCNDLNIEFRSYFSIVGRTRYLYLVPGWFITDMSITRLDKHQAIPNIALQSTCHH